MFKSLKAKASALLMSLVALVTASPAMAQIDVTGATTGITDGSTVVVTILTALLVAYGLFIGIRMALRAVKRGG